MMTRMLRPFLLSAACLLTACGAEDPVVGTSPVGGADPSVDPAPDPFADEPLEGLEYQATLETLVWPDEAHRMDLVVGAGRYRSLIVSVTGEGSWTFTTRAGWSGADACYGELPTLFVGTYWRDRSVPDDPWHFWPGGGTVCWPFPVFATDVYAGSADIEFAFVYANHGRSDVRVYAHLSPP